jgi:RNA polymerase sigma-70 factor (ECF subfamily)
MDGPLAGLAALDTLPASSLVEYQPYHATRADLLMRAGRRDEALAAYDRALELTTNEAERTFLKHQRSLAAAS